MNRISKKAFGNFIKEHRLRQGYTQEDLAKIVHVSGAVVSKWERGIRFPDYEILEDIATALGVTLQELYDGSKTDEKQFPVNVGLIVVGLLVVALIAGGVIISTHQKPTGPAAVEGETDRDSESQTDADAETASFYATISEYKKTENGATMLVTGWQGNDPAYRGEFLLEITADTETEEDGYQYGDIVYITYRGPILETYPAQITDVVSVKNGQQVIEPSLYRTNVFNVGYNANAAALFDAEWTLLTGIHYTPVMPIESAEELDQFFAVIHDEFNLEGEFLSQYETWDDDFFAQNNLYIVYADAGSGSASISVSEITILKDNLTISVQENMPEVGTCDMAGWFITVEMPKELVEGIESVKAVILDCKQDLYDRFLTSIESVKPVIII